MYVSGDWIAPRRMGVIWVDYPPMIYWAGTASAHVLGGMSEFALRLPNALTAICLVLLTCGVASRWFDPRTGLWAGFVLLTFQQFVYEAINYRPDTLFSFDDRRRDVPLRARRRRASALASAGGRLSSSSDWRCSPRDPSDCCCRASS